VKRHGFASSGATPRKSVENDLTTFFFMKSGDDNKTLWELIAAGLFLVVFLAIAALSLWGMGKAGLVFRLTKGYALFWVVLSLASWVLRFVQQMLRVEFDPPSNVYVFTNLGLSAFLQAGWSPFAALTVGSVLAGSSTGLTVGLHLVGFISSLVASGMVGVFYQGTLYKLVNAPLAVISYIAFVVWPAMGRAIYGWFFVLFWRWLTCPSSRTSYLAAGVGELALAPGVGVALGVKSLGDVTGTGIACSRFLISFANSRTFFLFPPWPVALANASPSAFIRWKVGSQNALIFTSSSALAFS
jgi:hypothetical protein